MKRFKIAIPDTTVVAESESEALRQASNALGKSPQRLAVAGSTDVKPLSGAKVKLKFHPQVWTEGRARPADPRGRETWWMPLEDTLSDSGVIPESNSHEARELAEHPCAPLWVSQWDGPSRVTVEDIEVPEDHTVEEFFEAEVDTGDFDVEMCVPSDLLDKE